MRSFCRSILTLILCLVVFVVSSTRVSAHQPNIPSQFPVVVNDPEISKAYYATMESAPQVYSFLSNEPFDLYVAVLVPDINNQSRDLYVSIFQKENEDKQIAYLDGSKFAWTSFFEPFGHDNYLEGPEIRMKVPAGEYYVEVSGKNPGTKYALATGEVESFGFADLLNTLSTMPWLKVYFFDKSPVDFLLSPIGGGYVFTLITLSFVFGFVFRIVMRKFAKGKARKKIMNIGTKDRVIRLILSLVIFSFAVTTTWNGIMIFVAGFCLFEAVFSWCGLFALMNKNTCPV